MKVQEYYLRAARNKVIPFTVPAEWKVAHFLETGEPVPYPSAEQMARDAFLHPSGTESLSDVIAGARSIAIIIDDATRPTPVHPILQELLSYIEAANFGRNSIVIVIALGTHKIMDEEALRERLGDAISTRYKIIQHNAWAEDLISIAIPGEKAELKINPAVAYADCKIGISSILPHPMAGYGGGPKILMPGIANYEFIRDHHMTYLAHPQSIAGKTIGNLFHAVCMKAARAIGLNFSINCVYDQNGQLARIVGGSLEAAFNEAIDLCIQKLGHKFDKKVDITIASTYPHSHGHQFFKGLSAPDMVTKDNGAILLMAPILTPLSSEFIDSFQYVKEKSSNNSASYIREHLSRGEAYLPDKSIDYNMAMSTPFLRPRIRVMLVSPMISEKQAGIMDFEYAHSVEEGLKILARDYPSATVAIFPSGGLIVPL